MRLLSLVSRLALWLYPPAFRRKYGEQIEDDVQEVWSVATPGRARMRSARRLLTDLGRSLPREWAREAGSAWTSVTSGLVIDMSAAIRSLSRHPTFSVGVMGLLAVGIAACVAVTSVVSAYVLRPLPYPEADRIVTVSPAVPLTTDEVSDLFELAVSWDLDVYTLLDTDSPEMVYGSWVSEGYLDLYGFRAALGRLFGPDEAASGAPSVAVISHALWQSRYGGDPEVIGRRLSAFTSDRPDDAEIFTIIGVLAADTWHHGRYVDFLTPLTESRNVYAGRLRPGVDAEAAARILEARGIERMTSVPEDFSVRLIPIQEQYTAALRPVLRVGIATVLLALLIACGNTAALLLVRAAGRDREFTVRQALGAAKGRLARQLLLEGFVLAGGAAVIGLGLAAISLAAFREPLETHLGRSVPGGLSALIVDGRALLVTVGLTLATGLVFGLTPMAGAVRRQLAGQLSDGGRGSTGGRSRRRALQLIVSGGVALSLTLVVPAALALRSARHVANLDPGFDGSGVFTGGVLLRDSSYPDAEARTAFFERLAADLAMIPGVVDVGVGIQLPFGRGLPRMVESEMSGGSGALAASEPLEAQILTHDAGFLETLGVSLVAGRTFGREDTPDGEPVAIVSRELGERLWPGEDPLGRRLRVRDDGMMTAMGVDSGEEPWLRVVGVVSGIQMSVSDTSRVNLHLPLSQSGSAWGNIALRAPADAPPPLADIKRTIRALDPTLALSDTDFLWTSVVGAGRPARFLASLLGVFAVFAIAVAVLGLYAVMSFAAAQRTRDVAIRIAIGARASEVVGLFMREGMALVLGGIAAGVAGAFFLSRGLAGQLHGTGGTDPLVYAACVLLLLSVGGLAAFVPARRVSRSDPIEVLRTD
jgi:putative ABC transport system permease protein